ncbi:MAG: peptide chain release factor N(5)-glutamine methyltransferase [Proteobacteria bacterium]|nr:peptide chain release factor N(5)-glutamine methyltransferase [Pseudomonadota bacterium]
MTDAKQVWTIQRMLEWSYKYFQDNHIDTPQLDAQILLGHVLGMTKMQLLLNGTRPLDASELAAYKAFVIRRAKNREPVAYILGTRGFWSLDLKVSPDVLIPRPDTECLVEKVLEFAQARLKGQPLPWADASQAYVLTYETVDDRKSYYDAVEASEALEKKTEAWIEQEASRLKNLSDDERQRAFETEIFGADAPSGSSDTGSETSQVTADVKREKLRIVDIGTGSGAIILAIASELSSDACELAAVDISPAALAVARENAAQCGLSDRIAFDVSDLLLNYQGNADIIVSNPPYISTSEMLELEPEVRKEPVLALEAGVDGLDIYKRLVPQAFARLNARGALFVEIGCTQSAAVEALFIQSGFRHVRTFKDYGHQPRVVFGIRD